MMSDERFWEIVHESTTTRFERFARMSPDEVMREHVEFMTKLAYRNAETRIELLGSARELGFLLLGAATGMLIGLGRGL